MDNKKLLDFAFNSEKAPKEVKDAAKSHLDNLKALEKIQSDLKEGFKKREAAENEVEESGTVLEKALASWKGT